MIRAESISQVLGEQILDASAIQMPHFYWIEPKLCLLGRTVRVRIVAIPRAIVPEINSIVVFEVELLFCGVERRVKSRAGGGTWAGGGL